MSKAIGRCPTPDCGEVVFEYPGYHCGERGMTLLPLHPIRQEFPTCNHGCAVESHNHEVMVYAHEPTGGIEPKGGKK